MRTIPYLLASVGLAAFLGCGTRGDSTIRAPRAPAGGVSQGAGGGTGASPGTQGGSGIGESGLGGSGAGGGLANQPGSGGSTGSTGKGCKAVDVLFVIDNSASMCPFQKGLAEVFPSFVDAMYKALPRGTDLHVGVTTTSVCAAGGSHSESNCKALESDAVIRSTYKSPAVEMVSGNGYQGRLLEFGGKRFFAARTDDVSSVEPLKMWFSGAATSVGCNGCSFDFSVASAAYVTHASNAAHNAGFLRDQGAVLVLFFLTDEGDHSPEGLATYKDMVVKSKMRCGGEACVVTGGLLSSFCAQAGNSVYDFLSAFGRAPAWGDIRGGSFVNPDTSKYTEVLGTTLTGIIKGTCEDIIID